MHISAYVKKQFYTWAADDPVGVPLSSCEVKAWKKLGLNRMKASDLYNTGGVLYQLS